MKLCHNEIEFIINCDVEKIVSLLQEDYGMTILDAFDTIYNSKIYKKLGAPDKPCGVLCRC